MGNFSIETSISPRPSIVAMELRHLASDAPAASDDLRHTLALTQAFVTVLLAEQAGRLTDVQRDLLQTIRGHVSRSLDGIDEGGESGDQPPRSKW